MKLSKSEIHHHLGISYGKLYRKIYFVDFKDFPENT